MNYQKELEQLIAQFQREGRVPTLLLHSCCAPCSSYVLEYLSNYFHITVFFYNPNIYPEAEFEKRLLEQQELILHMDTKYPISFLSGTYEKDKFYEMARGLEHIKEGGKRCLHCYQMRLEETAIVAKREQFDYFTTTLTISPLKKAQVLNQLGTEMGEKYGVAYLQSDFKKKNGYQRSIELSRIHHLYRQDYCGCQFSLEARMKQLEEKGKEIEIEKG